MDERHEQHQQPDQHAPERVCEAHAAVMGAVQGEVTFDAACAFTANTLHQRLHHFLPKPYPQPTIALQDYVSARAQGLVKREPFLARANADWLQAVLGAWHENQADVELFAWARERCQASKNTPAIDALERHLSTYELNAFPRSTYDEARRVQVADSDEARRQPQGRMQ